MARFKAILIELDDGRVQRYEGFTGIQFTEEMGYIVNDGPSNWDKPVDISPNGDRRMTIRAWKGCKTYESFTHKGPGGQ